MPQSDENDPRYLHKYRSLEGESKEWVRRTILFDELYFSNPTEFNDPYDCSPVFVNSATEDEYKRSIKSLVGRARAHLPRAERRRQARAMINMPNLRSEEFLSVIREKVQRVLNSTGVLSLSATGVNVLMWSHYADHHRGICLRFRGTSSTAFFGSAQPVIYQRERPLLNAITDDPDSRVEKALLTKADFWSYEKEWRIIRYEEGNGDNRGVQKFPSDLLDGIILGARISETDKSDVLSWVKLRKDPVQILQADLDTDAFRIVLSNLA